MSSAFSFDVAWASNQFSKAVDFDAVFSDIIMALLSSSVIAFVTQESMTWSTSAPVWPIIRPTSSSCSWIVKCSVNSGHNSFSSARTWVSRDALMAAHILDSLDALARRRPRSRSATHDAISATTVATSSSSCSSCS